MKNILKSFGFSELTMILIFATLFLLFPIVPLSAQDRGLQIQQQAGLEAAVGKQWAVFIAVDRYREWSPLAYPVKDAKEIRDILSEHYYVDEFLELYDQDATAAGIRQLLINLRTQVGRDDSVFVFYAGHGHTDIYTNTGFWIPSDGGQDTLVQANWLPNIQVRNLLAQLPARHVFLVSDSCFSGDILDASRGAGPVINNEYFRRAYTRVSRQVMTSGSSETVPDVSEFAMRLKSSLSRADGLFVDPHYLFTFVREVRTTQPLLGSIRGSEHQEGGSFLFFRKEPGSGAAFAQEQGFEQRPRTPVLQNPVHTTRQPQTDNSSKLWSVGASVGSSFSAPWVIGTVRGTIAPFRYSFLELGFDYGTISGDPEAGYYSLYPFAHYAFFLPMPGTSGKGGLYAGAGGGFMIVSYNFEEEGGYSQNIPLAAFIAGVNLFDMVDVSYSLRTNFSGISHKVSVGYSYRFK